MIDPQVLDTPDGFYNALCAIEGVCYRGDSEIAGMVSTLMSRSHILEYIISGTRHASALFPCESSSIISFSSGG